MPISNTTVLIVDDIASVRTLLQNAVADAGYQVRSADGGRAALAEIELQRPDILLSDLNMPGMSGLELLAEVRRRFPAIRTIAMSGSYGGANVPHGVLADAFHDKTAGKAALLRGLANLADRGHAAVLEARGLARTG